MYIDYDYIDSIEGAFQKQPNCWLTTGNPFDQKALICRLVPVFSPKVSIGSRCLHEAVSKPDRWCSSLSYVPEDVSFDRTHQRMVVSGFSSLRRWRHFGLCSRMRPLQCERVAHEALGARCKAKSKTGACLPSYILWTVGHTRQWNFSLASHALQNDWLSQPMQWLSSVFWLSRQACTGQTKGAFTCCILIIISLQLFLNFLTWRPF